MLKETTINDKNNSKAIAKLHQGHFKVKIAKKCENNHFQHSIKFNTVSGNYLLQRLILRHTFHTYFQEIEDSVNPGRGITHLFPLLHSFLNV